LEELKLTEEETALVLNRRKLSGIRLANPTPSPSSSPKTPENGSQAVPRGNRPPGWDSHTDLNRTHKGRLTEDHPFFFFEEEIFKKLGNNKHQEEHRKIRKVLELPVQANNRDRTYHVLTHMDVLWYEKRLPLRFKKAAEDLKKEHNIGPDNISEGQKKEGVIYPTPKVKLLEWDEDLYKIDMSEEFTGKVLVYEYR